MAGMAAPDRSAELLSSANALILALEKRIVNLETKLAEAETGRSATRAPKAASAYAPKALYNKWAASNAHRASARLLAEVAPFAIEQKTGRYYVISGSFSTLGSANWYRKKMARMGASARIIMPNQENKLYLITIAEYDSWEEGRRHLPVLKRTFGLYIWIKRF
jgi:cell division protein FtsN